MTEFTDTMTLDAVVLIETEEGPEPRRPTVTITVDAYGAISRAEIDITAAGAPERPATAPSWQAPGEPTYKPIVERFHNSLQRSLARRKKIASRLRERDAIPPAINYDDLRLMVRAVITENQSLPEAPDLSAA